MHKVSKFLLWCTFAVYVAFIYWTTVFGRNVSIRSGYKWTPLWTYQAVCEGQRLLIADILNNVLMFVPIGLLFGLLSGIRSWWKALLLGVFLSLGIELLQLYLQRGLCETDDIIHNTAGCMLGFALTAGVKKLLSRTLSFQR